MRSGAPIGLRMEAGLWKTRNLSAIGALICLSPNHQVFMKCHQISRVRQTHDSSWFFSVSTYFTMFYHKSTYSMAQNFSAKTVHRAMSPRWGQRPVRSWRSPSLMFSTERPGLNGRHGMAIRSSPFITIITMYHPTWDEDGSLRPIFDEICWQAKFRKQKPGLTDDRCCSVDRSKTRWQVSEVN